MEHEAVLDGFHEEGVAASCHLQELYCNQSIVYASRAEQHMRLTDGFPQLPASLTGLICLTHLRLEFEVAAEEILLACLASLGALQSLEVVASSVALPFEFSAMTSLRRLSIDTSVDDLDRMFSMALDFVWQALVSLEHVDLCGNIRGSAQFRLSDMTSLNRLQSVKVTGWYEPDQIIRDQLAELFYGLGRNRPDVLWHM